MARLRTICHDTLVENSCSKGTFIEAALHALWFQAFSNKLCVCVFYDSCKGTSAGATVVMPVVEGVRTGAQTGFDLFAPWQAF